MTLKQTDNYNEYTLKLPLKKPFCTVYTKIYVEEK